MGICTPHSLRTWTQTVTVLGGTSAPLCPSQRSKGSSSQATVLSSSNHLHLDLFRDENFRQAVGFHLNLQFSCSLEVLSLVLHFTCTFVSGPENIKDLAFFYMPFQPFLVIVIQLRFSFETVNSIQ